MQTEVTFSEDFISVINSIPQEIRNIEALNFEDLDIAKRYRDYHSSPDSLSGEENANVGLDIHPNHRLGKVYEGFEKMKSYEMMFNQLKKEKGVERATECLKEALMGSIAINDSRNFDHPYCIAFSSAHLMRDGRSYVKDVPNDAPTTATSYMNMTTEAMFDASAEFEGATVVFDILIGLAYYTKIERENKQLVFKDMKFNDAVKMLASDMATRKRTRTDAVCEICANCATVEEAVDYVYNHKIKNILQSWVHLMGNKFRRSYQSIFTNLNLFSPRIIKDNFSYYEYPNGDKVDDYIDEITTIQEVFASFFSKGITGKGVTRVVAMPVCTLMIPKDSVGSEELQDKDDKFIDNILKEFYKFNNLNVYRGLKLAMCCRITVQKPTHKVEVNSLGVVSGNSGYDAVGSNRVATSALSSIALEVIDKEWCEKPIDERIKIYLDNFGYKLEISKDILIAQRNLLKERDKQGYFKLTKAGWVNLEKLASTFGGVGMYEAVKFISGETWGTKWTEEGMVIANKILEYLDEKCVEYSNKYEIPFNMECSIPAESMAFRFKDREVARFGQDKIPYKELSNQFTPLTLPFDIVERLTVEDKLSSEIEPTGICHINIKGKLNPEQNVKLHKNMWANYPDVEHYAFNCPISRCENGHSEPTDNNGKCVVCGGTIVGTTSRSIGYFREVETSFGKNRQDEFKRRKFTEI